MNFVSCFVFVGIRSCLAFSTFLEVLGAAKRGGTGCASEWEGLVCAACSIGMSLEAESSDDSYSTLASNRSLSVSASSSADSSSHLLTSSSKKLHSFRQGFELNASVFALL